MKYDYLITYIFTSEKGTGIGRAFSKKINKIKKVKDVEKLEEMIRGKQTLKDVAITNYQIVGRYWR